MAEKKVNSTEGDPWERVAARLGTDLFLDLQPDPSTTARGRGAMRRRALADALRDAISHGRLPPGTMVPPYRSLAADLGLARGTVAAVYAELVAEGRLTARQGSGTRVAGGIHPQPASLAPPTVTLPTADHDFALGQPNPSLFPRSAWAASTRRALNGASDSVFAPSAPNGSETLRTELAAYLARARGVRTSPDCIVLTTSVSGSLDLLSRTVFGRKVAVESHGLPFHREVIARRGVGTSPLPVDARGADVSRLADSGVDAVVLTPSHQYPFGVALAPDRRAEVVEWATRTDAVIVEDDYDGELRYDRDPVGALQGLAPDSVIQTGSVSKSLSPAVRIGWLVLPPRLVSSVMWAKGVREPDASIVDQLVLADMIAAGTYDTHIRRSRQFYRARRDHLIARLAADGIEVSGIAAGLHAVIPLPVDVEHRLLRDCHARGFAFGGLDAMRHPDADPPVDENGVAQGGLVVGFASPANSTFVRDVDALATLITEYR